MEVILAKTAGFCYGVERAVELAKRTAAEGGCVMLGSIIHNAAVVQELEALGARTVEDVSQIQPGETVVIRSHGEPVETYRALEEKGAHIVMPPVPMWRGYTSWWPRRRRRGGRPSSSARPTIRRCWPPPAGRPIP